MKLKELERQAVQVQTQPASTLCLATGNGSTVDEDPLDRLKGNLVFSALDCASEKVSESWKGGVGQEHKQGDIRSFGPQGTIFDYGSRLSTSCFLAFLEVPLEEGYISFSYSSFSLLPNHLYPKSMHILLLTCCLFLTFLVPRNICPAARCLLQYRWHIGNL